MSACILKRKKQRSIEGVEIWAITGLNRVQEFYSIQCIGRCGRKMQLETRSQIKGRKSEGANKEFEIKE